MSVRRKTENRLSLLRTCGTCGKTFLTTAASPFMRQVPRDGKKQAITYYCSEACKNASYRHLFDGKTGERRRAREAGRDRREYRRRRYLAHAEEEKAYARRKRLEDPAGKAADNAYQAKKRRLLREAGA